LKFERLVFSIPPAGGDVGLTFPHDFIPLAWVLLDLSDGSLSPYAPQFDEIADTLKYSRMFGNTSFPYFGSLLANANVDMSALKSEQGRYDFPFDESDDGYFLFVDVVYFI